MQITYNDAVRFNRPMAFALGRSRDYMMRSEKRDGQGGGSRGNGGKRPPQRKRKAGFFYILFTILLSLIFWPVGMIMLWRRKVRWSAGVKLVFSLITLFLCIFLIVFALTFDTGNDKITRIQDTVNDYLDTATTKIAEGYDIAYEKGGEVLVQMGDFAEAFTAWSTGYIADGIDYAVDLAAEGKDFVVDKYYELTGKEKPEDDGLTAEPTPEVTDEPETTAAPEKATAEPTDAAASEPTEEVSAEATPAVIRAGETTSEPSDAEAKEPTSDIGITLPVNAPASENAIVLEAGTLTADGEMKPGVLPEGAAEVIPEATEEPEPTATPRPIVDVDAKDAGEAVVFYNASGTYYHMASSCKGMSTATRHTLAEAVADGKKPCTVCKAPAAELAESASAIWTDEANTVHTTNDCEEFEGKWNLMTFEAAVEAEYETCEACHAADYADKIGVVIPTPTPAPTATPEPTVVTPTASLKPVSEVTVYHSSNGKFYHRAEVCKGMTGSSPFSLQESVDDGFRACNTCAAPKPELIGKTLLWVDANDACHTTDECLLFSGDYSFIERDEALEKNMSGCIECGANEYLLKNTVIG